MESEEARARIQKLLVTGDNRLKQGVDPEKARESFEQALEVARESPGLYMPGSSIEIRELAGP